MRIFMEMKGLLNDHYILAGPRRLPRRDMPGTVGLKDFPKESIEQVPDPPAGSPSGAAEPSLLGIGRRKLNMFKASIRRSRGCIPRTYMKNQDVKKARKII
jgi:hypothetical protein